MKNLATFFKGCRGVYNLNSWVSQFREGRTSVRDKPRPRRPAEAVTPTIVANVEVLVNKNCRVTLQKVANQLSIG